MIRFSNVNRVNSKGYDCNYQRHHLIPVQAGKANELTGIFQFMATAGFDLDDFHNNGVLLPCCEKEAWRTGQPLHRGPHPRYNDIVIEHLVRIANLSGEIKDDFQRLCFLRFRTNLLQRSLHSGLTRNWFANIRLNSRNPVRPKGEFAEIDSQVDKFHKATKVAVSARVNFNLKSTAFAPDYIAEL